VPMYGKGETARDYTYISDIVEGIYGAMNYLFSHEGVNETANLGNNHPVKLAEMVDILYKKLGAEPNIQYLPLQPGDVNATCADISKAGKLFGYSPRVSFEEGIEKFIAWEKTNRAAVASEKN
jgi:UDP-glucuronate 4-epimerase